MEEAEVEVKLESQPTTAQPALMVEGELTLQTYRVAPIFVSLLARSFSRSLTISTAYRWGSYALNAYLFGQKWHTLFASPAYCVITMSTSAQRTAH